MATLKRESHITLVDKLYPQAYLLKDIVFVTAGAALTAGLAQVTIPTYPVPFTLQPLGVLLAGLLLGSKRGAVSQLAYLVAGTCGLPVFAAGRTGLPIGPTAGYLYGFILVAWLMGFLAEKQWDRKPLKTAAALVIGNLVMLCAGASWLSMFVGGMIPAFKLGIAPFLLTNGLQSLAAVVLLPGAWGLLRKFE
ncbi:MAG: biotin transporter BioY [Acidimicrobiales bacterium]